MELTLSIDDDVLAAARQLAEQQAKSVDEVISELSRQALHASSSQHAIPEGFPVLSVRDIRPITLEFVNGLRDGVE